jgi:hypothetical protein
MNFHFEAQKKNVEDRRFLVLQCQMVSENWVKILKSKERGKSLPTAEEHDASGWQPPLLKEQMSSGVHTLPLPL